MSPPPLRLSVFLNLWDQSSSWSFTLPEPREVSSVGVLKPRSPGHWFFGTRKIVHRGAGSHPPSQRESHIWQNASCLRNDRHSLLPWRGFLFLQSAEGKAPAAGSTQKPPVFSLLLQAEFLSTFLTRWGEPGAQQAAAFNGTLYVYAKRSLQAALRAQ